VSARAFAPAWASRGDLLPIAGPHAAASEASTHGGDALVSPIQLFAATLVFTASAMLLLWLVSLRLRDASIVDIWWGPGFVSIAAVSFMLGSGGDPMRSRLVLLMAALWGLRLGAYLFWRNAGKGEDYRYQAMRRHYGERFARVSLVSVFGLQGALMWFISLPLQVAQTGGATGGLGALDALGSAAFAAGLLCEALGDLQLARFKSDRANAGRVMDRGLWRYTRHPNYFGDCLAWWGIWLVACGAPGGVYTLASPLLMTYLLLRVSGVALLERGLVKRKPGYADYIARTSAFIPRPPRVPGA
jgi:steroid 5-alpha reductase family enzyme